MWRRKMYGGVNWDWTVCRGIKYTAIFCQIGMGRMLTNSENHYEDDDDVPLA
jgi:hypothetical protein